MREHDKSLSSGAEVGVQARLVEGFRKGLGQRVGVVFGGPTADVHAVADAAVDTFLRAYAV